MPATPETINPPEPNLPDIPDVGPSPEVPVSPPDVGPPPDEPFNGSGGSTDASRY